MPHNWWSLQLPPPPGWVRMGEGKLLEFLPPFIHLQE